MSAPAAHVPHLGRLSRVVMSVNPKAGAASSQQRVERLVSLLTAGGCQVEVCTALDDAAARAEAWHHRGELRALVGVGGDGTAAELVNRTSPGLPLTLLPGGTENLLARYFRLGTTPEEVARTVLRGHRRSVDAGSASGRIFLIMASCGADAEVVRRLHAGRRGHIHHRTYAKPIADTLRTYSFAEMTLHALSQCGQEFSTTLPVRARWLFAFNIPRYGGGMCATPGADPADGLLDVCTLAHGGLWHTLKYVAAIGAGLHPWLGDCTLGRVSRLRITADTEVPYQLDGDPGGCLPVELQVLSGRLTLLVPPGD